MGEPKSPHFYDFGTFEPVTKPQNQVFLSLETPEHQQKQGNAGPLFKNMILINLGILQLQPLASFEKTGTEHAEDPFQTTYKIL